MDGQQHHPWTDQMPPSPSLQPNPQPSVGRQGPVGFTNSARTLISRWWSRWIRLPLWGKVATIGGLVVLLCCCGGTAVALIAQPQPEAPSPSEPTATTATSSAASPAPTTASPTPATSGPLIERRTATETQAIPFERTTVEDPSAPAGTREVRTQGVPGQKTLTYEVTLTDGVETDRKLINEAITKSPVTEVTAVGTAVQPACDPNYSGCVPIAPDVDCLGGGGNGPAFVAGPVMVIGEDIYGLDNDNDGIGCE